MNTLALIATMMVLQVPPPVAPYDEGCEVEEECVYECDDAPVPCERPAPVRPVRPAPPPAAPTAAPAPIQPPPDLKVRDDRSAVEDSSLFTVDTARVLPDGVSEVSLRAYVIPSVRAGVGNGMEIEFLGYPMGGILGLKQRLIDTDGFALSAAAGTFIMPAPVGFAYAGLKAQLDLSSLSLYGEGYGVAAAIADESEGFVTGLLVRLGGRVNVGDRLAFMGEAWSVPDSESDVWFAMVGMRINHRLASGTPFFMDIYMPVLKDKDDSIFPVPLVMMNFGILY